MAESFNSVQIRNIINHINMHILADMSCYLYLPTFFMEHLNIIYGSSSFIHLTFINGYSISCSFPFVALVLELITNKISKYRMYSFRKIIQT